MAKFILTNCNLNKREIFPKTIGEIPKEPLYEQIEIKLLMKSSGKTDTITSEQIVLYIMDMLGEIDSKVMEEISK